MFKTLLAVHREKLGTGVLRRKKTYTSLLIEFHNGWVLGASKKCDSDESKVTVYQDDAVVANFGLLDDDDLETVALLTGRSALTEHRNG